MARKSGRVRVLLRKGHRAGEIAAVAINDIGQPSRDPRKLAVFDMDNEVHRRELAITGGQAIVLAAGALVLESRTVSREAYENGRRRRRER